MSPAPHSGHHPSPEEVDALLDRSERGVDVYDVDLEERVGAHVADCAQCSELLDGMREVRDLLRAEGARPLELPDGLDRRLGAAISRAAAERSGTIVPLESASGRGRSRGASGLAGGAGGGAQRVPRWLTVAAGLAVLGGAGAAATQLLDDPDGTQASLSASGGAQDFARVLAGATESGTEYTSDALGVQVLGLLDGTSVTVHSQPAPSLSAAQGGGGAERDPTGQDAAGRDAAEGTVRAQSVMPLTDPAALGRCLTALGEDQDPLAVDVGSWQGEPAAVVVVPGSSADTVQVWVVGPGCGQDGEDLRHFQLVQR